MNAAAPSRPSPLLALAAPFLVLALLFTACGSSKLSDVVRSDQQSDTSGTADSSATTREWTNPTSGALQYRHISVGLTRPRDTKINVLRFHNESPKGCGLDEAEISKGGETVVVIQAVAAACSTGKPQTSPGNGRHGVYVTMDDVPKADNVARQPTPLGQATLFEQRYFECTNSCQNWQELVAVIPLDHPADQAYPTIMVLSPHGRLGRAELQRYVTGLRPA